MRAGTGIRRPRFWTERVAYAGNTTLSQEWALILSRSVEGADDRVRQARELTERANYLWRFGGSGFIERYLRGELELVVRRSVPGQTKYGFVIRAQSPSSKEDEVPQFEPCRYIAEKVLSDGLQSPASRSIGDFILRGNNYIQQSSMLSHDVEVMEGEKRFIPSLIRFQRFDDRALGAGKPLYKFRSLIFSCREISSAGSHRELRIFGFTYAVTDGESRGENIETAADCIDINAGLDIERERERRFHLDYDGAWRHWRFKLFDTEFDISAEPGFDLFRKGWQLGYGPINACLGM